MTRGVPWEGSPKTSMRGVLHPAPAKLDAARSPARTPSCDVPRGGAELAQLAAVVHFRPLALQAGLTVRKDGADPTASHGRSINRVRCFGPAFGQFVCGAYLRVSWELRRGSGRSASRDGHDVCPLLLRRS